MTLRTILFQLVLWCSVAVHAQYGCTWMYSPLADSSAQVEFRQMYVEDAPVPMRAFVDIASTGLFQLYVNGYNVSSDLRTPLRDGEDSTAVGLTFDVTPFLRTDTNVVAVRYCPSRPMTTRRQIALWFYGMRADGSLFARSGGEGWLCRKGDTRLLADGGEAMDGSEAAFYGWNSTDLYAPALWLPAADTVAYGLPVDNRGTCYEGLRTGRVSQQKFFDVENDSTVVYDFGDSFVGMVRLTLRDARPGTVVTIGGLRYTCTGGMDEQAFRRFTLVPVRRVAVSGGRRFRPSWVQKAEGVEAVRYLRVPWQ